jgi:hypothetical protein
MRNDRGTSDSETETERRNNRYEAMKIGNQGEPHSLTTSQPYQLTRFSFIIETRRKWGLHVAPIMVSKRTAVANEQ